MHASSATAIVDQVTVRQLAFPLTTPYRLSSGDLVLFDPIVVELRDADGRRGWGEALVVPGYTHETVEGSWQLAQDLAEVLPGNGVAHAATLAQSWIAAYPGVASAFLAALDMLRGEPLLQVMQATAVPLLAPCQAHEPAAIRDEVESLLAQGFRTLKVKVDYRWQDDLERVGWVQDAVAGRATLRLDANRGFTREDGVAFARRLAPEGIELLEQPCGSDEWDANADVARASTVPVMLDESIYGLPDIERAGALGCFGFVKVKLKKIGSAAMLRDAIARIRALGMQPVLGDGVSIEIGCWAEACVASHCISNAGEMNGFLKVRQRLFQQPLAFEGGAIQLPAGFWPEVDPHLLSAHTRVAVSRSRASVFAQ